MPPTAAATTPDQSISGDDNTAPAPAKADSKFLSVEGIMMLIVAITLDIAGLICALLIAAFGIGAVLGRIVSWGGLVVFTIWMAMRGSKSPGKKGRDEAQDMAKKAFQKFLKKHWKKLGIEACPILGDVAPTFLMMWYSEFK